MYIGSEGEAKNVLSRPTEPIINGNEAEMKARVFISTERTSYIVFSYINGNEAEMKARVFISTERTSYIVFSYINGNDGEMEACLHFNRVNHLYLSNILYLAI